jgi:hypothetical protein
MDGLAMEGGGLQRFLSAHHCVHYDKRRQRTHLIMRVGSQSAAFVDIKPALTDEFRRHYAAEHYADFVSRSCGDGAGNGDGGGAGDGAGEDGAGNPTFLVEFSTPVFPLFFDIDFVGMLTDYCSGSERAFALQLVRQVQRVLAGAYEDASERSLLRVLVTGCKPVRVTAATAVDGDGGGDGGDGDGGDCSADCEVSVNGCAGTASQAQRLKLGLHLHCPAVLVTEQQALGLREQLLALLEGEWPQQQEWQQHRQQQQLGVGVRAQLLPGVTWAQVVDVDVFSQHRTLRMLWSRKASNKGYDIGRVYRLQLVVGDSGREETAAQRAYEQDPVALLRDTSVRTAAAAATARGPVPE